MVRLVGSIGWLIGCVVYVVCVYIMRGNMELRCEAGLAVYVHDCKYRTEGWRRVLTI